MGTGYLIISVYSDNIGQPVEGATVILTGGNIKMTLKTDSFGRTQKISLPCPDKQYSLDYQKVVKPYSTFNIAVKKDGLETAAIEGITIFDGTTALQIVYLRSEMSENSSGRHIKIPEHVLWGDYPPRIVVGPDIPLPDASSGGVFPTPVIPEHIIVHDGLPTNNSAANYRIPFADYIKNVASGEIYPTWPLETLRANIYAILSFTGNRVYSEWYHSKGYEFTITSSTQFDQKFVYGRNIYQEISDIVDCIFDQFIRRSDQSFPFLAQHNDGKRVNNPGWLSKWGSKELGGKGHTALQIIQHYYGDDFIIDTVPPIRGIPASLPGSGLTLDACGDSVQKIQLELNVIRSSYPCIPVINPPDGRFGLKTREAVLEFQKIFTMPETGIVDFPTWHRISHLYVSVLKMLKERYE